MAHQAGTGRLPRTRSVDEPILEETEQKLVDADAALDWVWRQLTSMRFGLVLILSLAALSVAGTVLVQAPAGVLADPAAKADWLDQVRPKYGGWTNVLDTLGLFAIFQTIWFRAIAGLLTISTLACSIQRIPGVLRTITAPRVSVGTAFFEHAPHHASVVRRGSPSRVLEAVQTVFVHHRYRFIVESDETIHLYADRFRWVPLAGIVGHLAIAVIVVGAIVGGVLGYRDSEFTLAEGSTRSVPTKPGVTVQLISFTDSYYAETGAPSDYASELVVARDGQEVARQTVRVNDPLQFEDLTFYQSFYGPAARLKVADETGTSLFEDGVALAWRATDGNRPIGSFTVPSKGLTVWVIGTGGSDDLIVRPGQARVEVYADGGGDTPVDSASLDPGKPATVDGLTFTFERELQFTGLSIARDPGAPLVWLGCALLFFGFAIRFTVPHRRIWGRITRQSDGHTTVTLAGLARGDDSLGREIDRLIAEIEQTGAKRAA